MGYITLSFDQIVDMLGDTDYGPSGDGKVRALWVIGFEDGTVATLYDWKESVPLDEVTKWHIGGYSMDAVSCVKELFEKGLDS